MRRISIIIWMFFILALSFAPVGAYDLGTNITIWDKLGTGTGPYGGQEDNEVEAGNITTQAWDLEGFFLKKNQLTMVGGFDFVNGEADPYYPKYSGRLPRYLSGDIFIATSGEPTYGPGALPNNKGGNAIVKNGNDYNYVVDLDFSGKSYTVYAINAGSDVLTGWFQSNYESNPWAYSSGGERVTSGSMTLIGYDENGLRLPLSDGQIGNGLLGGSHFGVTIDLSFLAPGTDFYAHFTEQCGNDNLMGHGETPVPEPATMFLLGTGLVGVAFYGRRRLRRTKIH